MQGKSKFIKTENKKKKKKVNKKKEKRTRTVDWYFSSLVKSFLVGVFVVANERFERLFMVCIECNTPQWCRS